MSDYKPKHAKPELPAIFRGLADKIEVITDDE